MRRWLIYLFYVSITCNFLLFIYVGSCWYQERKKEMLLERSTISLQKLQKPYKIAFLFSEHPSHMNLLCNGISDQLSYYGLCNCMYDNYYAGTDKKLLRAHIEEILNRQYDVICAFGIEQVTILKNISLLKERFIPIIFAPVSNPIKEGLVETQASSGNHLTGIVADYDYSLPARLLCFLKKEMSKVLFVFNASKNSSIHEKVDAICGTLAENGVLVDVISDEGIKQITACLKGVDALITLHSNMTDNEIKKLVQLCNKQNITFFANDRRAVLHGAAFGFDLNEYFIGVVIADKIKSILIDNKRPEQIPITSLSDCYRLFVNREGVEKQGSSLEPVLDYLMRNAEVVP